MRFPPLIIDWKQFVFDLTWVAIVFILAFYLAYRLDLWLGRHRQGRD